MTSYILLVSMLQGLIIATSLNGLAGEIYSGQISQHFLKPQRMFLNFAANEAADKLRNILFSIGEAAILITIFKPVLMFPDLPTFGLFLVWSVLGTLIYFYITILFGCLGFWSPETWGPKFLFFMFLDFTAGKLFPLDILPDFIQKILYLTPFPYLSYVQIQLFLKRVDATEIIWFTVGLLTWTIGTWWLATRTWEKGSHSFEATGQ